MLAMKQADYQATQVMDFVDTTVNSIPICENDLQDAARSGVISAQQADALWRLWAKGEAPMALPLAAVARLEEFPRARLEHIGDGDAIQYRGEILPLVYLSEMFGGRRAEADLIQVVVHTHEGRSVGFVVDAIDDIVEQQPAAVRRSARRGVLGAAVIQGRVTELLDIESARSMMEEV